MANPIERFPGTAKVATIVTPSGPLSVLRTVAARLLDEKLISGDLDGVLHANDAVTVKAAMMAHGVCDFCSAPGIERVFDMPDFDMGFGGTSTNGWAACGTCTALVEADRRKDLLNRATNSLAFSKFTKSALKDLHNKFWYSFDGLLIAKKLGSMMGDFADDKLPDTPPELKFTDRDARVGALSNITGLSVADLERVMAGGGDELLTPDLAVKVMTWAKNYGKDGAGVTDKLLTTLVGGPRKPVLVNTTPHWQQALDAQVSVTQTLGMLLNRTRKEEYYEESVDLNDPVAVSRITKAAQARAQFRELGFDQDYRLIRTATVYSFNAETEAAIIEASSSIPHHAPLSAIETPTGSGWFWFGEPLKIVTSPSTSDRTHALLWAWMTSTKQQGEATLMFSAYALDEKDVGSPSIRGKLLPSTRWYWPLSMSVHEMLAYNAASWRQSYGPGSPMDGDPAIMSEEKTLKAIADLSVFFAQACLWFRQTVPGTQKKLDPILTKEPGHIERHARKRAQKELKADAPPIVHVVALRKTAKVERDPSEHGDHEPGSRDYQCRWIVKGHSRLQACGPGRKDRKLIWIEAHPAGPEDKPLRTKTTVFAVVR